MIRHAVIKRGSVPLTSLFRHMHISSGGTPGSFSPSNGSYLALRSTLWSADKKEQEPAAFLNHDYRRTSLINPSMVAQARSSIVEMPIHSLIRPSIGIPPEMLRRSEYQTPSVPKITPLEIPTSQGNLQKEIRDSPDTPSRIEKQAARLIVIRRSKMNKHKLRKLRKKMKYVWAKIRLRRKIKREKEYLNSKMDLIKAAQKFDAKEYVAGIIQRAKECETPVQRRWTDPLMPEWYKEQELTKIAKHKRYQKMINLYLNKAININWKEKKKY